MIDINEITEEQTKKDIIINGIMRSKGIYCLVANAKVGKSMLSLQLSDSLANKKLDLCQVFRHNFSRNCYFWVASYLDLFQFAY